MTVPCYSFVVGGVGRWRIEQVRPVAGENLGLAARLDIREGRLSALPPGASWLLRGVVSNARYTTRETGPSDRHPTQAWQAGSHPRRVDPPSRRTRHGGR